MRSHDILASDMADRWRFRPAILTNTHLTPGLTGDRDLSKVPFTEPMRPGGYRKHQNMNVNDDMSEMNEQQPGGLIQAYVTARWGHESNADAADSLGESLDPELKERIDILGGDGQRLLDVDPGAVLDELERLEQEAAREDARVAATVVRADAHKKKSAVKTDAQKPARRDAKARPGGHRKSAANGRRRQRGKP